MHADEFTILYSHIQKNDIYEQGEQLGNYCNWLIISKSTENMINANSSGQIVPPSISTYFQYLV